MHLIVEKSRIKLNQKLYHIANDLFPDPVVKSGTGTDPTFLTSRIEKALDQWLDEWVEEWADTELTRRRNLYQKTGIGSLTNSLAHLHKDLSGAESSSWSWTMSRIIMAIKQCPYYEECFTRRTVSYCVTDLLVAAILQQMTDTPVKMDVRKKNRICIHEYRPAWHLSNDDSQER